MLEHLWYCIGWIATRDVN